MTRPKLIGVMGEAGSGKDTFTDFLAQHLSVQRLAFAEPFKIFAGKVFRFNNNQLWGPTSARNAVDRRYSFSEYEKPFKVLGLKLFVRTVRPDDFKVEQARRGIRKRYRQLAPDFCKNVSLALSGPDSPLVDTQIIRRSLDDTILQILQGDEITPRLVCQLLGSEFGRHISPKLWIKWLMFDARKLTEAQYGAVRDTRFLNEAAAIRAEGGFVVRIDRPDLDRSAVEKAGVKAHSSEKDMWLPEMGRHVSLDIKNNSDLSHLQAEAKRVAAIVEKHFAGRR